MHERGCNSGSEETGQVPFAAAWEAHQRAVYRACLALLGGRRDDADEVFSRVAMQAFQKWPRQLNDAAHAKAWLLAVTRNACVDLHRERLRNREISLDAAAHDITSTVDPEKALVHAENRRRLRTSMRCLPMRLRVVAEMHFVTEMSYRDIARELGISEPSVRKRAQEARAALRRGVETIATWTVENRSRSELPVVAVTLRAANGEGVEHAIVLQLPVPGAPSARRRDALRRYIARHPRGWRKRLDLARTLTAMGDLHEAAGHYRYVVARQPFPLPPWIELGTILTALGRLDEAAEVYAEGARRAGRESDREHLRRMAENTRAAE